MIVFLFSFFVVGSIANVTWDKPISITSTMFFFSFCIVWTASVHSRITKRRERRFFVVIGMMMLLWMVERAVKYSQFLDDSRFERHLWYGYYIPIILIPLFTLMISLCLGKTDEEKLDPRVKLLYIPAALLIFGFMTNDLHQLAFSMNSGFENWRYDYSYGFLYYLVVVWIAGNMLAALFLAVRFSAKNGSRKRGLIPLAVLLVSIAFVAVYIFTDFRQTRIMNVPELFCFCIAAYLEACLQTGLIPSNTGYELLFLKSHLSVIIADADGRAIYNSSPEEKNGVYAKHEKKISGGTITWYEDITTVTEQKKKLEEANAALTEMAEIRKRENELKEESARIAEQAEIYGKINASLAPQTELVRRLVAESEKSESTWKINMPRVCVIGAYIKRKSNLMLLAARTEKISSSELSSALRESLSYLEILGASTEIRVLPDCEFPSGLVIYAYDEFEKLVESRLSEINLVRIDAVEKETSVLFDIKVDGTPLLFELEKEVVN